jgi:hypothetical protein
MTARAGLALRAPSLGNLRQAMDRPARGHPGRYRPPTGPRQGSPTASRRPAAVLDPGQGAGVAQSAATRWAGPSPAVRDLTMPTSREGVNRMADPDYPSDPDDWVDETNKRGDW